MGRVGGSDHRARSGLWIASILLVLAVVPTRANSPLVRTSGRHFVDPGGRVVILRGINLAGNSKVPPFLPGANDTDLDRIRDLGANVVRLLFVWEGYEPLPGCYDEGYLATIRATASAAWARGIHVIIDFHQDGFSRFTSRGSGDGFPAWAVSGRLSVPDNGPRSRYWPLLMATDPSTYRSFRDFYSDAAGVRTRFLTMLARVAPAFAATPGVIGYDILNEPWGDEQRDLAPLYRDAAAAIRAGHPEAILFLEGHLTTNAGIQSRLPRPCLENVAYAPHYYKPSTIAYQRWSGSTQAIDRAFEHMETKAEEWDTPLFLGEFGAGATIRHAGEYVEALYDRLDDRLASGTQWNYTPGWNDRDKDGWNVEDFNILCPGGGVRPNYRPRPYPRATSGIPLRFTYQAHSEPGGCRSLEFTWDHQPDRGETEVFLPTPLFPPGTVVLTDRPDLTVTRDLARQVLICRATGPGLVRIRLVGRD